MGTGNAYGDLAIQLENNTSFNGQEITGIVHIFVRSPMVSSTLHLRFRGKEKTSWTETRTETYRDTDGKTNSRTVTDYYKGKHHIVNFSRPIFVWPLGVMVGQYSLPFSFRLPGNVPGSFQYREGSIEAMIIYKFQAVLTSITSQRIKGKYPICLKQGVSHFHSNLSLSKSANLRTWCFFNKGKCNISVSYPQDTYSPSQVASFYAEVDNSHSKLQVSGVTSRLFFTLRLKDNFFSSKVISKDVIRETVHVQVSPGERLLDRAGVEISLNLPSRAQSLNEMYSTQGKLIECVYSNEITADMEGSCMCCGDSPSIKTFMNIIPNMIAQPSAPVAPEGWNPEVLERVNIVCEAGPQPSAPELV